MPTIRPQPQHRLPRVAAIELERLERRYGERVALGGVTRARGARARRSRCSAATAPGRRPCCGCSPACCARTAARARVLGAGAPRRALEAARAGGLPRPRAAALPRADRRARTCATTRDLHGVPRGARGRRCSPTWTSTTAPTSRSASSRKGMVQRLAVARAVLHDPALLLLDEPRANLDPAAAELLEPLIGRASGRTRVLVSHDVEGALAEADVALGLRGPAPAGAGRTRSCTGDRGRPHDPPQGPADRAAAPRSRCRRWRCSRSPSTCCSTSGSTATRSTARWPPGCSG